MNQNKRFLHCSTCGNLVGQIRDSGQMLYCCEKPMEALTANAGGSKEKHCPQVQVTKDQVKAVVGEGEHPMTEGHYIEWMYLETDQGGQRKNLSPNDMPGACFAIGTEKPLAIYAYCNQHGLWRSDI